MPETTPYTTLISTEALAAHLGDPEWAVVDCRFSLADPALGRLRYLEAHIAGAVYADLNQNLSAAVRPGKTGRHPLPDVQTFAATLGRWGIGPGVQVVVYDDAGGGMAARLWWMLRWLGHDAVAVLDGDWRAWQREGRPTAQGEETRPPRSFIPHLREGWVATAEEVAARLGKPGLTLLDARAADRFRGENETLDPKAGHIPGARSAPYLENLDSRGYFLPPEALAARFAPLVGETPVEEVVVYCGSGVTAAHNLLALAHAGLGNARLYAGSWSDWITDPNRPIATGAE
ncbi:MAG TPA: sulfurtransferase [Caldilineaceae bacterium]|nr:sulfurtransferase [Caldilineaceae bacterium]